MPEGALRAHHLCLCRDGEDRRLCRRQGGRSGRAGRRAGGGRSREEDPRRYRCRADVLHGDRGQVRGLQLRDDRTRARLSPPQREAMAGPEGQDVRARIEVRGKPAEAVTIGVGVPR